jgi:hypothetical protein
VLQNNVFKPLQCFLKVKRKDLNSVVDPDLVKSKTFSMIRIRIRKKSFRMRIRAAPDPK